MQQFSSNLHIVESDYMNVNQFLDNLRMKLNSDSGYLFLSKKPLQRKSDMQQQEAFIREQKILEERKYREFVRDIQGEESDNGEDGRGSKLSEYVESRDVSKRGKDGTNVGKVKRMQREQFLSKFNPGMQKRKRRDLSANDERRPQNTNSGNRAPRLKRNEEFASKVVKKKEGTDRRSNQWGKIIDYFSQDTQST